MQSFQSLLPPLIRQVTFTNISNACGSKLLFTPDALVMCLQSKAMRGHNTLLANVLQTGVEKRL